MKSFARNLRTITFLTGMVFGSTVHHAALASESGVQAGDSRAGLLPDMTVTIEPPHYHRDETGLTGYNNYLPHVEVHLCSSQQLHQDNAFIPDRCSLLHEFNKTYFSGFERDSSDDYYADPPFVIEASTILGLAAATLRLPPEDVTIVLSSWQIPYRAKNSIYMGHVMAPLLDLTRTRSVEYSSVDRKFQTKLTLKAELSLNSNKDYEPYNPPNAALKSIPLLARLSGRTSGSIRVLDYLKAVAIYYKTFDSPVWDKPERLLVAPTLEAGDWKQVLEVADDFNRRKISDQLAEFTKLYVKQLRAIGEYQERAMSIKASVPLEEFSRLTMDEVQAALTRALASRNAKSRASDLASGFLSAGAKAFLEKSL